MAKLPQKRSIQCPNRYTEVRCQKERNRPDIWSKRYPVTKMNFRGDFCFFLTTDHRYALASPHWSFLRKLGHREQKNRKCRWAEKILGVEYRSASNSGTHRDKCFVGWNRAFLTIRPHGRHVFPTTFWAEQETLDALPLFFCLFPTNWRLSETLHTPGPVNSIMSICWQTTKNEAQGT